MAVLCKIFDSFSSNAKGLLFTCKLKVSLPELGHQCVHIMLISIIMVLGHCENFVIKRHILSHQTQDRRLDLFIHSFSQ